MCAVVLLSLGSNIGDRAEYLRFAIKELAAHPQLTVKNISSLYQTAPWGNRNQADYYNAVVGLKTELSPRQLLSYINDIEKRAGRQRSYQWAARELDIDILLYDDLLISEEDLTIPHPYLHQRLFVLIPLREVCGNITIPGKSIIDDLLQECAPEQRVEAVPCLHPWYEE